MKQLLSRENFELWLAGDPEIEIILDHLKFLDMWVEKMRNGGSQYVQDLKNMGYENISNRTKKNP